MKRTTAKTLINLLRPAVDKNATLPALKSVLIVQDAGGLHFTTTNLEQRITVTAPIPGKPRTDIVTFNALKSYVDSIAPSGEIHFHRQTITFDTLTCPVTIPIPPHEPDSFPYPFTHNTQTDNPPFTITSIPDATLPAAFASAIPCMSKDATRYVLQGVLYDTDGTLIATDGRRLYASKGHPAPIPTQAIIPATALRCGFQHAIHINFLTRKQKEESADTREYAIAYFNEDIFSIRVETKLIEGTFPNYHQVIPPTPKCSARFNRKDLLSNLINLARLTTSAEENQTSITLRFGKNCFTIGPAVPSVISAITLPFISAHPPEIGDHISFNHQFFQDALFIGFDTIAISSPTDPAILSTPTQPNTFLILMPTIQR